MEIVPRSGWGAKMPNSVHIRPIRSLDGVAIHWFGSPKGARKHADCPGLLRAVQRGHMAGEYPFPWNNKYGAIVVMIGTGQKPSAAALKSLKWIIAEYPRRGAGKRVITHGSITGSKCPGPVLTQWVRKGLYAKPTTQPPVIVNMDLEETLATLKKTPAYKRGWRRMVELVRHYESLRKKK
jgi:hypothetical protein